MPFEVRTDVEYAKPLPAPDATSAPFWRAAAQGELRLQRCPAFGHRQNYPRPLCTAFCVMFVWWTTSGRGAIYTFTVIRQYGAKPFRDELPYVVAMIELEGGVRLMANVTDCAPEDVHIDMAVEAWAVRASDDVGIPYFRPAHAGAR